MNFTETAEFEKATPSAKVTYLTRIGILCADGPVTDSAHQIAYEEFKSAVRIEAFLTEIQRVEEMEKAL